ncbi:MULTISPECIES: 50S ribosomal protein L25 [Thermodesulfovibrio]|uniref:Large ribosomal subunit protein bL25 n=2 Tax=Thermodesulfovibrio yellowstonii TaxID=28262 RepID=RL25_THEYD|nr:MULTISPECIES: 50S ribosomal protein L25 [Thermodesulfovibrio]B5YG55.1 RecName: Full=Large ribosomal subunit protein bL25; AltName: Full=50S ribosomal protein L25; AltName: Full=General stress protein CTC [Thermodesulfovibrio yellowstonii DSM 11347]ACI21541.1 ribosomal protein L25, Ctc-form [Thermodesulfovibrio yellowstonii DSM 11347]GLI53156.1 50S ribosomal protein L25 [Thermodesulfovibrio islandicus]
MEKFILNVEKRERTGKGIARQLRSKGIIPCVIYKNGQSTPVQIPTKELYTFMNIATREKLFVTLKLDGQEKQAILQDYQVDPVTGKLLHVDFMEVSATEKIRVTIPVVLIGEPIGVKQDKGVLQHGISEIEIEAIPEKIPGHIEVDVSHLEVGDAVHVSDIKFEEGIKVISNPEEVIATVTVEEEEAEVAPSIEETVEPEVIKKGKKAEEEEEK